jgi:hypothetical protein
MITFQRVIRRKGSKVGERIGKTFSVENLDILISRAKRHKNVFAYVDSKGNQGIVRSGRKMRTCDSVVLNMTVIFVEG